MIDTLKKLFLTLSTLTALVCGVILIYDRIIIKDYKLKYSIENYPTKIPSLIAKNDYKFKKQFYLLQYLKRTNKIEVIINNSIDSILEGMHVGDVPEYVENNKLIFQYIIDSVVLYNYPELKVDDPSYGHIGNYIVLTIKNTGTKELEDLKFCFPSQFGIYEYIIYDGSEISITSILFPPYLETHQLRPTIYLGNLQPNKTMEIKFWTWIIKDDADKDIVSITFKNGDPIFIEVPDIIIKKI